MTPMPTTDDARHEPIAPTPAAQPVPDAQRVTGAPTAAVDLSHLVRIEHHADGTMTIVIGEPDEESA